MEETNFDTFGGMQFDTFKIRVVSDETNEFRKVVAAKKEIVFVETELPNALRKSMFDFLIRRIVFTHPYLSAFVQNVGRAMRI